jgi:hypothetical protein
MCSVPDMAKGICCIMKIVIVSLFGLLLLVGCTEKAGVALQVLRDKAENKLVEAAGEGEVAIELYRSQYAALKEKLVCIKTLQKQYQEEVDNAYATADPRRRKLYEGHLKDLNAKAGEAERGLQEFFAIYQHQREEIRLVKDEIASFRTAGALSDTLGVTSTFEKRAEDIRGLMAQLKEKANRARSLLEVNVFEETYTKR